MVCLEMIRIRGFSGTGTRSGRGSGRSFFLCKGSEKRTCFLFAHKSSAPLFSIDVTGLAGTAAPFVTPGSPAASGSGFSSNCSGTSHDFFSILTQSGVADCEGGVEFALSACPVNCVDFAADSQDDDSVS